MLARISLKASIFLFLLSVALPSTSTATYAVCTEQCNSFVLDRICNENDVSDDEFKPTESSIRIGVIRSFTGNNGYDFAIMCAWEHATDNNTGDGMLADTVDKDMVWLDADSGTAGGVKAGLCMRKSGLNLAVGPGFSTVSAGAALIGNIYEQNLVSTTATSPLLSDTDAYAYFSRVITSDAYQGTLLANYAYENNWMQIAMVSISPDTYFDGITGAFSDRAVELGIDITSYTITDSYTTAQLEEILRKIRVSGIRIVTAAMKPLKDLLVVANSTGMLDEGWGWLTTESSISILNSNVWGLSQDKIDGMEDLLDGVIGLVPAMNTTGEPYSKWENCVKSHFNDTTGMFADMGLTISTTDGVVDYDAGLTAALNFWGGYYYDGMYFVLKALNSLDPINRTDPVAVRSSIRNTSMYGTSGLIKLNEDGDRTSTTYEIGNVFNQQYNVIGTIDAATGTIYMTQEAHFPGGVSTIPVDMVLDCTLTSDYDQNVTDCVDGKRTVSYTQNSAKSIRYCPDVDTFEASCDYALFAGVSAPLMLCGIVYTLAMLGVVIVRWKHRIIRLAQREFLVLMLLGALVAFTGPLLALGPLDDFKCAALPCFTSIGYTLLFGPLFVKTWRVSVLMRNNKMRRMKIMNNMLYKRLFALFAATSIMLVAMWIVDPALPSTHSETVSDASGSIHLVPFQSCEVDTGTMGMLMIFLLGAMTAYGCFVSYQIRNVSSELSEARWIFLSVYNGALLSLITLAVVLGLDLSYSVMHQFASLGIFLTCTVTISLIMGPKIMNIHNNVSLSTGAGTTTATGASTVQSRYGVGSNVVSSSVAPQQDTEPNKLIPS